MALPRDSLEMKKALRNQGLFVVEMIGYPNDVYEDIFKKSNDF
jgi:isopenicillin N synthase-like dioxygenase